jgi:hypothetical protein
MVTPERWCGKCGHNEFYDWQKLANKLRFDKTRINHEFVDRNSAKTSAETNFLPCRSRQCKNHAANFNMAEITIRLSDRHLKIAGMVIGAVVLIAVFFHLWSSDVFAPKYQLRVFLPSVTGLAVNTQVRLDGVLIGSVHATKLAESSSPDRSVQLLLRIDTRYREAIRSDSVATILPDGILGARYLMIRRGYKGSPVNPDGEIPFIAAQEISFSDVLKTVQKSANCLEAEKPSSGKIINAGAKTSAPVPH